MHWSYNWRIQQGRVGEKKNADLVVDSLADETYSLLYFE